MCTHSVDIGSHKLIIWQIGNFASCITASSDLIDVRGTQEVVQILPPAMVSFSSDKSVSYSVVRGASFPIQPSFYPPSANSALEDGVEIFLSRVASCGLSAAVARFRFSKTEGGWRRQNEATGLFSLPLNTVLITPAGTGILYPCSDMKTSPERLQTSVSAPLPAVWLRWWSLVSGRSVC